MVRRHRHAWHIGVVTTCVALFVAVIAPPASAGSASPTSAGSAPLASAGSASPASAGSAPPTSAGSAPLASAGSTPPTGSVSVSPAGSVSVSPASAGSTPPTGSASGSPTGAGSAPASASAPVPIDPQLAASVAQGPTEVIVAVDSPAAVSAYARAGRPGFDPSGQQSAIDAAAGALAAAKQAAMRAAGGGVRTTASFDHLPVQVVTVDSPQALADLAAAPGVTSVTRPGRYRPTVDADLTVIRQPAAAAAGYTGAGVSVAVIDTGVNWMRAGVGNAFGDCSAGPGSWSCRIDRFVDVAGIAPMTDVDPDGHGTNVSGVVAKTAPAAHLEVYGVFTADLSATDDAVLTALNDITATGVSHGIRSVNLSLGDNSFHTSTCTGSPYSAVFSNLRALGILPVVAAGNNAYGLGAFTSGVSAPACAAGAIAVGASYPQASAGTYNWGVCADSKPAADQIACFSQGGPLVSLVAPGVDITAAGVLESGTSQATPHVAAGVADVACANPHASASQIAGFLTSTGPRITDSRGSTTPRRLDIAAAGAAAAAAGLHAAGGFVSVTPARLLDTRFGTGAAASAIPAHGTATVQVTGQCGVPAAGVAAVVLNVTATGPTQAGFITAYASGGSPPLASNVNFVAGQTVPNLVVAPVGVDGKVSLYNGAPGSVDLVADISGYYVAGSPAVPGAFGSVPPLRLLDTRTGTGIPVPALGDIELPVTGTGGVPASGVSAVVLNVTVTDPSAEGFITAHAAGTPTPLASNLNFVAGQTVPNLVIAPVSNGKIALHNGASGTVHLVADIAGYVRDGTVGQAGMFGVLPPTRVLDTRFGTGAAAAPVAATSQLTLKVTGTAGVPASGVAAVALNVTATGSTAAGYITAYASGGQRPLASNLNFVAGQTVPNLVIAPVGTDGKIALYNGAPGSVQLVADVAGYFLG